MTNPAQELPNLQEMVRLLTLENDRLSDRATDLHLLSQLAARTNQARDPEDVIRLGLELIALLKDIPLCTTWQLEPEAGRAVLRHVYCTLDAAPAPNTTLPLPPAEAPNILLAAEHPENPFLARLAASGFPAHAALRLTLPAGPGFSGFFLFADHRPDHRLRELAPLLGWAADLIGARHLNLHLQQALERSNHELEARVADRTRTLREAFSQLQQEIVDRRRAEDERRQLEATLQQTQKLESLGVLAGGIAHDFNNLLTGILGNAGLAKADLPPGSPALEPLCEAELSARRAADLCRQLLAYSGRARLVVQPLDLRELVRETLKLLHVSLDKKTLLQCHLPDLLPAIEADATQLRQVLMNLVINGSEALHGREGTVRITASAPTLDHAQPPAPNRSGSLAPGPHVCLEITDTGCGMDAATLARVFEPFFTTKFTGRGLGLSAVLGIVRAHNGAVEVESEPGRGSTFRVWFPASPRLAPPPTTAAHPTMPTGSGHVLLVDDEETVRRLGSRILERAGFRVTPAPDGLAAMELFRRDPDAFDCVVLDLTMPRMDGVETLAALKALRPGLPVLLTSGYSEHELTRRFRDQPLAGFLEKPYEVESLVRRVCEIIQTARPATESQR